MGKRSADPPASRPELDFEVDPLVLREIADDLGLGVFTVDRAGRFVSWSAGAERVTGHAARDVRGKPCRLFEGPECKGFEGLADLLADPPTTDDAPLRRECRLLAKDGSVVHVYGAAKLLRDDAGEVVGAIGEFVDLTDVLRLNAPAARPRAVAGLAGLLGESPSMIEVFRRIRLASGSDVTTLVTGESGTGKELAARAIHALSDRAKGPFRAVNCSALTETLLESELFGHVEGSFTGAVKDRAGLFESADGGTLFLDEIGDVSPLMQLKLLRVLQEREVVRVGDEEPIQVDVRLVAATNRDLRERIASGAMREDFYYRIRVFEIRMPPLRERREDVPRLAQHFVEQAARTQRKQVTGIARDALEALVRYPWPGNVRELQNACEYAMVVQTGDLVGLLDLPEELRGAADGPTTGPAGELTPTQETERLRVLEALEENGWNRTRTAESLGFSRVTLWKKMRKYRIDEGIFRRGTRDEPGG